MFGRAAKKENEELHYQVEQLQSQITSMEQLIQSLGAGDIQTLDLIKQQRLSEIEKLESQRNYVKRELEA